MRDTNPTGCFEFVAAQALCVYSPPFSTTRYRDSRVFAQSNRHKMEPYWQSFSTVLSRFLEFDANITSDVFFNIQSRLRNLERTMGGQSTTFANISLDSAGLVALADLATVATRTALIGSASYLDVLFLAPGMHRQQNASEVNGGEQPATAAMTTGYVFRVENQATVNFLQRVGVTGKLVTLKVKREETIKGTRQRQFVKAGLVSTLLFLVGPLLTLAAIFYLGAIRDWWGLGSLLALMLARLINVVVIRQRSKKGWKGMHSFT
jgi:hypothetical protein